MATCGAKDEPIDGAVKAAKSIGAAGGCAELG